MLKNQKKLWQISYEKNENANWKKNMATKKKRDINIIPRR